MGLKKLKKYRILIVATVGIIGVILAIPAIVRSQTPSVQVVAMQKVVSSETVHAQGEVSEVNKTTMSAQVPMVIEQVNVKEGDSVKIGDVIATVNRQETAEAITSIANQISNYMPDAAQQVLAQAESSEKIGQNSIPKEIIATASGTLSTVGLEKGKLILPGQTMASISDLSNLCVVAYVPEESISQVAKGQSVKISGDALGSKTYTGTIESISPTAKSHLNGLNSETAVDVNITFNGDTKGLRPGYNVDTEIAVSAPISYNILPYEAVEQDESGNEYVLLYDGGYARKVNVVTGKETEKGVEIKEGIPAGSLVIYSPTIKENSRVKISSEVTGWNS